MSLRSHLPTTSKPAEPVEPCVSVYRVCLSVQHEPNAIKSGRLSGIDVDAKSGPGSERDAHETRLTVLIAQSFAMLQVRSSGTCPAAITLRHLTNIKSQLTHRRPTRGTRSAAIKFTSQTICSKIAFVVAVQILFRCLSSIYQVGGVKQ